MVVRPQPDVLEDLARLLARLALLPAHAGRAHDRPEEARAQPRVLADEHVLERRHRREQADVLERPRHPAREDPVRPHVGDVAALEEDAPRRRPVEAGEHVEERGLARAVRPDDRDDRLLRDRRSRRRRPPSGRRTPSSTDSVSRTAPSCSSRLSGSRPALRRSCPHLVEGLGLARRRRRCRRRRCPPSSSLRLRSGSRPSGRSTIMITSRKPKIPKLSSVRSKSSPTFDRHLVQHVGDQVGVRRTTAPPRPARRPRCCRARRG